MKVLFSARHFGYLRNFAEAVTMLAERGHEVRLVADRDERQGGREMVEAIARAHPRVSVGRSPKRVNDPWMDPASSIRLGHDYLRFLDRRFSQTPELRRRARQRAPALVRVLVHRLGFAVRPARAILRRLLALIDEAFPIYPPFEAFLRHERPDVVIFSPLIDLGSPQIDLLKAAKAVGLRTVLAVGSWDHLSSKALIRYEPDLVTVWNATQQDEATRWHGVPAACVAITGAQCYDRWFARRPSRSRAAFCRDMGLPEDRPFVLYVCSSLFRGGRPEVDLTLEWIRTIRSGRDPRVRDLGILVRPHPSRTREWEDGPAQHVPGVAVHGANPVDDTSRSDYFDALYHAAAVVGLNTSAFLEAAIVGKPVLAVLYPDHAPSQEGTLHFHYLLEVGGGLLRVARDLPTHVEQLADAVSEGDVPDRNASFVRAFIRPYGLDQRASVRFAEAIERLASVPAPAPTRGTPIARGVRACLVATLRVRRLGQSVRRFWQKRVRRGTRKQWQKGRRRFQQEVKRRIHETLAPPSHSTVVRQIGEAPTDQFEAFVDVRSVKEAVTDLASRGGTILVGPWVSEAGFELLYWIPFVRWAMAYANIRADRLVAVSRGGADRWYHGLASRYADVFDYFEPADFLAHNARRIEQQEGQKHFEVSEFDEAIRGRVTDALQLTDVAWLHPQLMYRLFRPVWLQQAPDALVEAFTMPRAIDAGSVPEIPGLPDRYVAVKFYGNQGLPSGPENDRFVAGFVARLVERHHVVMLQTGVRFDDHPDFRSVPHGRVHTLDHVLTPRNNIDVQTRVIAGAEALMGTYGGFCYLGPLCGVDTLTVYSNPTGFRADHMELALRAFRRIAAPSFLALDLRDLPNIHTTLGSLRAPASVSS